MKNSSQKEESSNKKRYIFFSDPDVIIKRAESSAVTAQIAQDSEIHRQSLEEQSTDLQVSTLGIKSLENLLSYHPVQPYPFTFISAVKQKLALGDCIDTAVKTYDSNPQTKNLASLVSRANSTQNLSQIVQKMDLVRPLKVPDLKISPKTLDFSNRDNSISKEPLTKSEIAAKEFAHDRSDKAPRTSERVQRKLDFSSSDVSVINCESIEPLKAPNVSIAYNLSKKKEHVRDNSREKENRSKRMKKDESLCVKKEELTQDQIKRSRSPRHVSRKDTIDSTNIMRFPVPKNDRLLFHTTKNNDSSSTKSKIKNFITSTAKKDNDKRQRSLNTQSVELTRDNSLSKSRIPSNESSAFRSWKAIDKVTLKDNSVGILSSNNENKSKDISHSRQRPEVEDLKYKTDLDNRQSKQDKSNAIHKEQTKRISDKSKTSNKIEGKLHNMNSESSEDIESMSETSSSKNRVNVYPNTGSAQQTKSNDSEMITESKENVSLTRSTKTSENSRYTEHSMTQSANTSTKKDEESYSQSTIATKETTANDDSNNIDVNELPQVLFDPRRISFRDGYSQEEFPNLITPEKMNLVLKSKRRKYLIQSSDSEVDARYPKYKSMVKQEKEQEEMQLMHPTALHMQFQAELHLYDSFNESLRQVMDVEKHLYNTKREQKSPQKEDTKDEELEKIAQVAENRAAATINDNTVEKTTAWNSFDYMKRDTDEAWKSSDEAHFSRDHYIPNQENVDKLDNNHMKIMKTMVKVAEVQTQTVNDIATQTDALVDMQKDRFLEIRGNLYEPSFLGENEVPQLSLNSIEQFKDLDQIEEISLPSRIRTMSEISLHETTSSIKTETGTEISISTRDVTCSFNKYLDLEIAELIKDENQRCNKIEMLFKSREKTLNDRTKKLVKLEEQKRALKDTGQDSRSVKKKQRALLLKLQQEKDEIYRLKQLYEITSQERKLMLQKQRDMFNPQMSTKNILTKLKRSADSQSPRRLSGPMKGYDIRSNSSMSSLIDSDKSQHDRSQIDTRLQVSESDIHSSKLDPLKVDKFINLAEESNISATRFDDMAEKSQKKYELKSRKYEDIMPRADILRQKQNQLEIDSKRIHGHPMKIKRLLENQGPAEVSSKLDASTPDYMKSESDTLVEELSKKSRVSQIAIPAVQTITVSKEKVLASDVMTANSEREDIEEEINTNISDAIYTKTTKSSQVSEDVLQNTSKNSKKVDKSVSDKDIPRKLQHCAELKTNSKRKNSKYQRMKSSSSTLTENILRSKSNSHMSEELVKHHDKRTRVENELLLANMDNKENSLLSELNLNESENSLQALVRHSKAVKDKNSKLLSEMINDYESKEKMSSQNRKLENDENYPRNEQGTQNVSQISFAISHHSSGESEKNFSKSIVVRSQERDFKTSKKLEQILTARETALASRKNCVEEWMAWHTRLRTEEDRVTRMEQAAFKLVAAASNVLSQQEEGLCSFTDTTISSDTSDVESRIELLTEKLAERRVEMARLKREAKKQAKKQLRALEANLLNQIKKYDTTIHEMRKKLESKKAIKETDKLAIEPKSLADFKVPEIPLKRIQDIYKSSDLLRSRSESDLLLTRDQLDLLKIATPITYDDRHKRDNVKEATKSTDIKSINATELKDTTDNCSVKTIFDEYTSEMNDNFETTASVSSNELRSGKYISSMERQLDVSGIKQGSASYAQTSGNTVKSELEMQTLSDARFEDPSTINTKSANNKSITDQSHPKTLVTQSEIQETDNVDNSRSITSKSDYHMKSACISTVADSNILTYSKKLDFLQLNNKNLSDDISSIENDIKALSEIMSRLANESNEKSKTSKDEVSTSQDISEMISKTIFSNKIANITDEERQTISSEKKINTESVPISIDDRKSKSLNESNHDKYISDRINNEMSISEEVPTLSNSTHEIDYEAKSKEIMNQIEKSIISEHVKIARDDYNASSVLENKNEKLLSDTISELNMKSISEILSKVSENRKSLDLETNSATQIVDDSKKDISEQDEILSESTLKENFMEDQTDNLSQISEYSNIKLIHSPIIAGHRSKESYKINSQGDLQSVHSVNSIETSYIISENLKSSEDIPEALEIETSIVEDSKILNDVNKNIQTANNTINSTTITSNIDQNRSCTISAKNISQDKDDWTTSDSFEVPQDKISIGEPDAELENTKSQLSYTNTLSNFSRKNVSHIEDTTDREAETNLTNIVSLSALTPKGESNVDVTFNEISTRLIKSNNELDDILDIIAKEDQNVKIPRNESEKIDVAISDSMAELLDKVEDILQYEGKDANADLKGILYDDDINQMKSIFDDSMLNIKTQHEMNLEIMDESNAISMNICTESNHEAEIDISSQTISELIDKSAANVDLHMDIMDLHEEDSYETESEAQRIITKLDLDNVKDHALSKLEIVNIELTEEKQSVSNNANDDKDYYVAEENKDAPVEIKEYLDPILEQDSSDGEQRDNLIEVTESGLDTVEKFIIASQESPKFIINDIISVQTEETEKETVDDTIKKSETAVTEITHNINKTFDILKDPEYEDISEESLEVSEILDKHDNSSIANKSSNLPDTYRATQKSEEVLRILDEISQKSTSDSTSNSQKNKKDALDAQSVTEEISELLDAEVSVGDGLSNKLMKDKTEEESYENESRVRLLEAQKQSMGTNDDAGLSEKSIVPLRSNEHDAEDKSSQMIYELRERVSQLQEQDGSSESSEAGDTPRGVSEIEMDSPRNFNDSRLDIDVLDDDLLSGTKTSPSDVKTSFHSASIVATSEKDIEAMIDKLKASLEQPGLEVAELETKLLHIEQLQIELEIKKLEAEEVSYYVREIPNKPPPPYTPPGDGRLSTSLGSPSLMTVVTPSNVEELTSFTEKATILIYNAKLAGEDIASLEASPEIYELNKDKNEVVKKDRRIYNTFLFDLCKEIIMEVYRAEYEKPGPSWTKPNVKTKPTMKIPKTVEELIEYVNKEVATLFGFKTKLQRENMVMRWSRKRRDRVDELLAREAQAEEDEWTKFHHDELTVKNGLTVAILDTLVMETVNVVKTAYKARKQRM